MRDEEVRSQYDKELHQGNYPFLFISFLLFISLLEQSSSTVAVSDEISLDDMQAEDTGGEDGVEYSWPCRFFFLFCFVLMNRLENE